MSYIAPLLLLISLVMVVFTDPDGQPFWIDRGQVVSVSKPISCIDTAKAQIGLGNGTFVCVKETVHSAVEKLDGKK